MKKEDIKMVDKDIFAYIDTKRYMLGFGRTHVVFLESELSESKRRIVKERRLEKILVQKLENIRKVVIADKDENNTPSICMETDLTIDTIQSVIDLMFTIDDYNFQDLISVLKDLGATMFIDFDKVEVRAKTLTKKNPSYNPDQKLFLYYQLLQGK